MLEMQLQYVGRVAYKVNSRDPHRAQRDKLGACAAALVLLVLASCFIRLLAHALCTLYIFNTPSWLRFLRL